MARTVTNITQQELINLARSHGSKLAIIDVRDSERRYCTHIPGSHHFPSRTFTERMPELLQTVKGTKDTLVFHCSLSEVRGPTCAQMFLDYLSKEEENPGINVVMLLVHGLVGWTTSGRPVCRCTDVPCSMQL